MYPAISSPAGSGGQVFSPRAASTLKSGLMFDVTFARKFVEGHALDELRDIASCRFEQETRSNPSRRRTQTGFALRREQGGMDGRLRSEQPHVVGDDALQQFFCVIAANAYEQPDRTAPPLLSASKYSRPIPVCNKRPIPLYVGGNRYARRASTRKRMERHMAERFDLVYQKRPRRQSRRRGRRRSASACLRLVGYLYQSSILRVAPRSSKP